MKYSRNCRFALILIVFSVFISPIFAEDTFTLISPKYFGEQDIVYDNIHYLENEYLSFKFCTEETATNIKFELSCNDAQSITPLSKNLDKNKKGCYFSNYDLEKMLCDDFTLNIDYTLDNKEKRITRTFTKQKQSKLINHVLGLEYDSLEPLDLSYYLAVLNDIETFESKMSIEAYDVLKNDRDNSEKCWPKSDCEIEETSEILLNLKLSQYPLQSRLLEDGSTYLEQNMISNINNPLDFYIEVDDEDTYDNDSTITCELTIDEDDGKNYLFDTDENSLLKSASNSISFSCNQTVEEITFKLYNLNDNIQEFEVYDDSTGFTFTIEDFGCIGEDYACDYSSTINVLNTYGSSIDSSSQLANYLDTLVIEDEIETYLDVSDEYKNIGKYLFYENNAGLKEYLKYHQNNDGSWGKNSRYDRIEETAWAILGLQSAQTTEEYILDGKKWIYYNEPDEGWGSVKKNSLAYLAIKEQIKPYLRITSLNTIENLKKFEIENPTIYNIKDIKLTLSKEINDYVSYTENLGDLNGEEKTTFNISIIDGFYGELTGELTLTGIDGKNKEIQLVQMPINIKGPTPFNIIGGNYSISDDSKIIKLKLEKNIASYQSECSFINPFTKEEEVSIIDSSKTSFDINNPSLKQGNFTTDIRCIYDDNVFTLSPTYKVEVAEKSFNVSVNEITITELADFSLVIQSLISDKQVITAKTDGNYKDIIESAEKSKIVAGKDVRDIFFTIKNPILLEAMGNQSSGNIIIESDTGYTKKIPLYLSLGNSNQSSIPQNLKWYIGIGILILLMVGIVLYRYYQLNKEEETTQYNSDEEIYLDE